jgi:hypothetical protein
MALFNGIVTLCVAGFLLYHMVSPIRESLPPCINPTNPLWHRAESIRNRGWRPAVR